MLVKVNYKRYFIGFFLTAIIITSCRQKSQDCNVPGGYDFLLEATLSPANTTYSIGDTISVAMEFSDTILDRTTGRSFVLEDWGFFIFTSIFKIDNNPLLGGVETNFDLLVDDVFNMDLRTSTSEDLEFYSPNFIYENNTYSLAYKFIPKEPGLFYFRLGVTPNDNQTFEGICEKVGFTFNSFVESNEGADNNFEFVSESLDTSFQEAIFHNPEERYHRFGGYSFRVIP